MSRATMVRLGEVLRPVARAERVDAAREYKILGARWYAQGLFVKDVTLGQTVRAEKLYQVREGDFVYNRLFAWKGSFALASAADDGCHVSNEFPCFEIDRERLEPQFLRWWFAREAAWNQALGLSTGATPTSRNRLKEADLLSLEIPLPPLPQQRRVVARIEEVADFVGEAGRSHEVVREESAALLVSRIGAVAERLARSWPVRKLGSFSPHVTSGPRNWSKRCGQGAQRFYRAQDIGLSGEVLAEGKVFLDPPPGRQGRSAMLAPGDLMIVITGATVGRLAVFRNGLELGFVSQHVAICRLPASDVDPEYVHWILRGPAGTAQLLGQRYGQGKPGLNLGNIRSLAIPIPPLREQLRVVAELAALESEVRLLGQIQSEVAAELDALLPAVLDRAIRGGL